MRADGIEQGRDADADGERADAEHGPREDGAPVAVLSPALAPDDRHPECDETQRADHDVTGHEGIVQQMDHDDVSLAVRRGAHYRLCQPNLTSVSIDALRVRRVFKNELENRVA